MDVLARGLRGRRREGEKGPDTSWTSRVAGELEVKRKEDRRRTNEQREEE